VLLPLALLLLALVAPAAWARSEAPLTPLASIKVVGSGPLLWNHVAVHSAPSRSASVVTTLTQFRPDFHPRSVLAIDVRTDAAGRPTWYRITVPGRPNGRTG
jgi:hypothetical protein